MKKIILKSLSSPGCHNCKIFEEFWHSIESQFPNVEYSNVNLLTPEGMEMAGKYQIMASPGIVINDELFSVGGIDKDVFLKKIKELSTE